MTQLELMHVVGLGLQVFVVSVLAWVVVREIQEWRETRRWERDYRAQVEAQRRWEEMKP